MNGWFTLFLLFFGVGVFGFCRALLRFIFARRRERKAMANHYAMMSSAVAQGLAMHNARHAEDEDEINPYDSLFDDSGR
jgi:Flp pilus assembly protein TadB